MTIALNVNQHKSIPIDEQLLALNPNSILTNWAIPLRKLGYSDVPPLTRSLDLFQFIESDCPIRKKLKENGTHYKVCETHAFYYIPPGTFDELSSRVNNYAKNVLCIRETDDDEYPFRFNQFGDYLIKNNLSDLPHRGAWIAVTKDVLPGSRDQHDYQQFRMIEALSKESEKTYEPLSAYYMASFIWFHYLATGEFLYQARNAENGYQATLSRVTNVIAGWTLSVGRFNPYCLRLTNDCKNEEIGISAMLEFN